MKNGTGATTTAKMKFLFSYNMNIVNQLGGHKNLVGGIIPGEGE